MPVWVEAPADAGRYVLEFDLVHEHVRWFESPLVVEMNVVDRGGGYEPTQDGQSNSFD